jgi:8-oxo-dGTP diphosphatase
MPWKLILIHVAVGVVINPHKEILIAERPAHKYCPGLWEFPGGKIEQNESPFAALQREFQEEIGIQIISADAWFQIKHDYPDRQVLLEIWRVTEFQGKPHGAEGQLIRWIAASQLDQYQFPDGNVLILQKLKEELLNA